MADDNKRDEAGKRPADLVPVHHFRQILIWPLMLQDPRSPGNAESHGGSHTARKIGALARKIARDGQCWTEVLDPLEHVLSNPLNDRGFSGVEHPAAYGEVVYFHDYVEKFLYKPRLSALDLPQKLTRDVEVEPFYLYRRTDISSVAATVRGYIDDQYGEWNFVLAVERLNFYLFRTGGAFLVVELASSVDEPDFGRFNGSACEGRKPNGPPVVYVDGEAEQMTLAHVQLFTDQFRRAFVPYWTGLDKPFRAPDGYPAKCDPRYAGICPGQVPFQVTWCGEDQPVLGPDMPPSAKDAIDALRQRMDYRGPEISPYWRKLLPEQIHLEASRPDDWPSSEDQPTWRHIVDDRIPTLTYVSLTDRSQPDPHQSHLMGAVSRGDYIRLCFADPPGTHPLPYSTCFLADFEEKHCYDRFVDCGTRYMFAGYAFTAIGAGTFFDRTLIHHFRRNYFQMALLAHLEHASLIGVSSRISDAVERCASPADDPRFANRVLQIQSDFLEFVHRFRFTGVSNQTQAMEMFDAWRKHLRLDELFRETKQELDAAVQYQFAYEGHRSAQASNILNVIATIGLVFALAFGLMGMNIVFDSGLIGEWEKLYPWLPQTVASLVGHGDWARGEAPDWAKAAKQLSLAFFFVFIFAAGARGMVSIFRLADRSGLPEDKLQIYLKRTLTIAWVAALMFSLGLMALAVGLGQ